MAETTIAVGTLTIAQRIFEKGQVIHQDGKPYVVVSVDRENCCITVRPVHNWPFALALVALIIGFCLMGLFGLWNNR